jgi:hypothetical protein
VKRTGVLWFLAVVITLVSAYWQRTTGPTYPVRGEISLGGDGVEYTLARSHGGPTDQPVQVVVPSAAVRGEVRWRRYPTTDRWERVEMHHDGRALVAALPNQPPAGKLEYQVALMHGSDVAVFPAPPAVTRFKGEVAPWILAPHVLAMFMFMLLGTRAGLGALAGHDVRRLAFHAFALLIIGGFLLGPAVQKQAFNEWWAGIPYGWDLTDNKTVIALLAWAWAVIGLARGKPSRAAIVGAAVVTLAVFAIPHSMWGSQIDWQDR